MDKPLEFVAGIIPKFVEVLRPDLEENTQTLQRKIGLLESRKDDIDEELQNELCRSGKKRKREVECWMNYVENIIKRSENLVQGVQSIRFYNVFKRQKFAEELERMNEEVTELDKRDFPGGLFIDESNGQLLLPSQPNGQQLLKELPEEQTWTEDLDKVSLSGCLLDEFPTLGSAGDSIERSQWTTDKKDKIEWIMRLEEEEQMEEIIIEQQSSTGPLSQILKKLRSLIGIESLTNYFGSTHWRQVAAPLRSGTFSCLGRLWIYGCGKIKKLFHRSLVHNFHNLQELIVIDCVQMEEIIEGDNNEGADIKFPRLKSLFLRNLPQVKSICKGKMICDSIEYIYLGGINNIKKLPLYLPFFHGQLSVEIDGRDKEWWESLERARHNIKYVLQPSVKY